MRANPPPVKYNLLIFLLFIAAPSRITAQVETKIDSGLQWYYKHYPQEKVYVHTDKDKYIVGQHIWFSIYSVAFDQPTEISKIIYLQLVNTEGKVVAQTKLPMVKGRSNGDLVLPDSLNTNLYQLRCFTAWMLNFDEFSVFHKTIYIHNPSQQVKTRLNKTAVADSYHVDFFPESGDLVDGNLCKVAFKAIDENGMPVDVSGEIVDEQKNHITSLQTIHDGMGEFSFLPHTQHKYYGNIQFNDGSIMNVPMPGIKAFGVTLRMLEQNKDEIDIAIFHHDEFQNQYQHLILAVYQNSGRTAVYPLEIETGKNIFSINKKLFSTGILRFTLFDQNGVPLAERVSFLEKNDELRIGLIKDSLSFSPRSRNVFSVEIKNIGLKMDDSASLSVSVTDADAIGESILSNNIFSSILIASELKGYINDPAYYFINDYDSVKYALDLVMLTNGWRHFKWEEVLNEKPIDLKYAVENEQDLEGQILGYYKTAKNKEGLKLKILIQNEDSSRFIGYAEPDSNGRFILRDYSVKGRSTIFFEGFAAGKNKGKSIQTRVQFSINTLDSFITAPYLPQYVKRVINSANNAAEANFMLQQQQGMLKAITIRGQQQTKTEQVISKYVSSEFREGRASSIDFINNFYPNNYRMFDFLKGRFPGLTISGREDLPIFDYEGQATLHDNPTDSGGVLTAVPYFYVNEVQTSWEDVKNIPFSDIALIQFLPPPVAMAPFNGGFRGVITIYLKKGDEFIKPSGITENYNHYIINGFSVTREFHSPDYSIPKTDASIPDLRTTLYWNPHLAYNSNETIKFHFFNSDKAKRFLIVIEGMDESGRMASLMKIVDGN